MTFRSWQPSCHVQPRLLHKKITNGSKLINLDKLLFCNTAKAAHFATHST